ncbi:acetyl-CoA carboxylase biotin carboxylase subunit [Laceyella putida]|uniref:biotin carboxylase n=1 Tax=Laceyella putida TaxID=110101 RepID=A0ABW2RMX7_9BACL
MQKVLIANRGEIACRIMRTCQARGWKTVAVYSEADQMMPFVEMADEAICIGPTPVAKSYLNQEAILDAAKRVQADALHPGYGFLSENASFAKRVQEAGLLWIGPEPVVIRLMGDKVTARATMLEAGVPIVPGTGELASLEEACQAAKEIGYPVMVKASAGGGGIGMQVCQDEAALRQAYATIQAKARAYFGDASVYIEKWISPSRHVEVQIVADTGGKVLHLFERDCSVQRRNQKVIEESLAPSLSRELRKRMHESAVAAAQAVRYTGVGTVEFLVGPDESFYFLEMNTRLQVEHPVTEMITGLDLVAIQCDLARGETLSFGQEDILPQGHAIEYRIYAEDPVTFYPSPGTITAFEAPTGEGIRVDAGVKAGTMVSPYYDPLLAKCIVSGSNREEVLAKSREVLQAFKVEGIKTNLPLLRQLVQAPAFVVGQYDTQVLSQIKLG